MSRFLRICSQSSKKVQIWPKKKFSEKIEKDVKKRRISRWFRIRWKSCEKIYQKKVISKNVTEKCTFFTFNHVRQTCFAYNFFHNFFNGFEISVKICVFWQLYRLKKKKKILGHISFFKSIFLINIVTITILHESSKTTLATPTWLFF